MKASRYMKPPRCHKLARVTVRDAGPALGRPETHQDTQHAAHLIGEIRASERGWEVTKGTTSPCPSRVKSHLLGISAFGSKADVGGLTSPDCQPCEPNIF